MPKHAFRELLEARQIAANTLVCVGLDPLAERAPPEFKRSSSWRTVLQHMQAVVDATAPYACMFKPQSAYYESVDNGRVALQALIDYITCRYPTIPVFLDCKRGDIDRTQEQYRRAHLDLDGAHGANINPYMGEETFTSMYDPEFPGRGIVALCYTSNPGARVVQEYRGQDGTMLYEHIAKLVLTWAERLSCVENTGLVMAAAYERPKGSRQAYVEHLVNVRLLVGDRLWFLIPGIGTQQGLINETVQYAYRGPGSIAVNSSSGICFANDPGAAAKELRDLINQAPSS